jgi:methylase of polypeptide subunit release factors
MNKKSLRILKKALDGSYYALIQKLAKIYLSNPNIFFIKRFITWHAMLNIIRKHKKSFLLFKLFLWNKKITLREAYLLFSEEEIKTLIRDGILIKSNNFIFSKYAILPYEGKYFLSDKFSKNKYFVYTGFDTLLLLNEIKDYIPKNSIILDVGTGPGTIAISIAENVKKVIACDINPRAIEFAKLNLILNGINIKKVDLKKDDYKNLINKYRFDVIISNPPCVPVPSKIKRLCFSLHNYGGESGLEFTFELIKYFYKSKAKKLFLIIWSGCDNGCSKIIEFLKKYNLKVNAKIIGYRSIYSFIHSFINMYKIFYAWDIILKTLKKNRIDKFYGYVIRIEKSNEKHMEINTVYKPSCLLEALNKIYYFLRLKILQIKNLFPR